MRQRLEQRLRSLEAEFQAGQEQLANLEARQASLKETMLRISGAIQVLQEVLAASPEPPGSERPELEIASEQEVEESEVTAGTHVTAGGH